MANFAPIHIQVEGPAPAKDGARSIRGERHPHAERVRCLRRAMAIAMEGREPIEQGAVRLHMRLARHACGADALNLINGVADVIQKRHHRPEQRHDVWVIADDGQIREFTYQEVPAARDSYEIVVTPLDSQVDQGEDLLWA